MQLGQKYVLSGPSELFLSSLNWSTVSEVHFKCIQFLQRSQKMQFWFDLQDFKQIKQGYFSGIYSKKKNQGWKKVWADHSGFWSRCSKLITWDSSWGWFTVRLGVTMENCNRKFLKCLAEMKVKAIKCNVLRFGGYHFEEVLPTFR